MAQKVQIKRTITPNSPPVGLSPGELVLEMDTPTRLWVGVPAAQDASLRKLLIDTTNLFEHGQCKLRLEGANLVLRPLNGNKLRINGRSEIVPDAGVSLAPSGPDYTLNYIYAFMNAGVMALELSTAAHSRDPATGIEIKTGDPTRTLVGMARTQVAAFSDTEQRRLVRTWFNDEGVVAFCKLPAQASTTSGAGAALHANWFIQFLLWDNEIFEVVNAGSTSTSPGSISCNSDLIYQSDGVNVPGTSSFTSVALNAGDYWSPYQAWMRRADPLDRMAYFQPSGFITGTGTGFWHVYNSVTGCTITGTTGGRR